MSSRLGNRLEPSQRSRLKGLTYEVKRGQKGRKRGGEEGSKVMV